MAASPACLVPPASTPKFKVDKKKNPTGRSLLPDFEQVSNSNKSNSNKSNCAAEISVEPETNVKVGFLSPNCVMNPPHSTSPAKIDVSSSPPASPEQVTPLVQAAQKNQPADPVIPLPDFKMHQTLAKNLSQSRLNRISFYGGVIHDINKEATEMSSNDTSSFAGTNPNSVIIEEEQWLINTIANRNNKEIGLQPNECPSSFAEAIGETEVDGNNPMANLNSSRTQLWKPSRSWWEARSGKNPWIEPRSHNKRWRYLWPLIHYHKFLARCIKKLKRHGVEVRYSNSPVCVFLRDEVCAISDHLAEVSKFTAEEWLESLQYFNGWTDFSPNYETSLRKIVSEQKLRSLIEPSDVDSPLLRDQVDEQFLRAMENARINMQGGAKYSVSEEKNKDLLACISEGHNDNNHVHPSAFNPVLYNRFKKSIAKSRRYMNQHGHLRNGFNQPAGYRPYHHDLSHLSYHQPPYGAGNPAMYQKPPMGTDHMHGHYLPPHQHHIHYNPHYTQHQVGSYPNHMHFPPMHELADFHVENLPWPEKGYSHPNFVTNPSYNGYGSPIHLGSNPSFPLTSYSQVAMDSHKAGFHHPIGMHQQPLIHDSSHSIQNVPQSPFWGHLDPMTGIASPQHPSHPQVQNHECLTDNDIGLQTPNHNSKPVFFNPSMPYFQPSPATQFLMSQTHHTAGYFYNSINMASNVRSTKLPFESPQHSDEAATENSNREPILGTDAKNKRDTESE